MLKNVLMTEKDAFLSFNSSAQTQKQDKEYVLPNSETASFISELIFAV